MLLQRDRLASTQTVNGKTYKLLDKIGQGSFGTVHLAQDDQHKKVALKIVPYEKLHSRDLIAYQKFEAGFLRNHKHQNIIELIDFQDDGVVFILVLELCQVSLSYLLENKTIRSTSTLERVFLQLCKAIQHLHDKNIIHRDLKPQNIMIKSSDEDFEQLNRNQITIDQYLQKATIKLIDFGISKLLSNQEQLTGTRCGSLSTMAPEINENQPYGKPADIYSMGCVFHYIVCQELPQGPEKVNDAKFQDKNLLHMVKKMINKKPSERITIEEIIQTLERQDGQQISEPGQIKLQQKKTNIIMLSNYEDDYAEEVFHFKEQQQFQEIQRNQLQPTQYVPSYNEVQDDEYENVKDESDQEVQDVNNGQQIQQLRNKVSQEKQKQKSIWFDNCQNKSLNEDSKQGISNQQQVKQEHQFELVQTNKTTQNTQLLDKNYIQFMLFTNKLLKELQRINLYQALNFPDCSQENISEVMNWINQHIQDHQYALKPWIQQNECQVLEFIDYIDIFFSEFTFISQTLREYLQQGQYTHEYAQQIHVTDYQIRESLHNLLQSFQMYQEINLNQKIVEYIQQKEKLFKVLNLQDIILNMHDFFFSQRFKLNKWRDANNHILFEALRQVQTLNLDIAQRFGLLLEYCSFIGSEKDIRLEQIKRIIQYSLGQRQQKHQKFIEQIQTLTIEGIFNFFRDPDNLELLQLEIKNMELFADLFDNPLEAKSLMQRLYLIKKKQCNHHLWIHFCPQKQFFHKMFQNLVQLERVLFLNDLNTLIEQSERLNQDNQGCFKELQKMREIYNKAFRVITLNKSKDLFEQQNIKSSLMWFSSQLHDQSLLEAGIPSNFFKQSLEKNRMNKRDLFRCWFYLTQSLQKGLWQDEMYLQKYEEFQKIFLKLIS